MIYLDEIFLSLQGESRDTGLPCIFVRLWGCPIGCSYCDQPQDKKNKKRSSVDSIMKQIYKYKGVKHVCITGGEPLIYREDLMPLVYGLIHENYKVSIETSGCLSLETVSFQRSWRYIMDIKCPSSGVKDKNIYDNLLKLTYKDDVVFVIRDRNDYDFMKKVLKKYPTQAEVLLSPMFDENGEYMISNELVNWILEDKLKCRVQIQLHKILKIA